MPCGEEHLRVALERDPRCKRVRRAEGRRDLVCIELAEEQCVGRPRRKPAFVREFLREPVMGGRRRPRCVVEPTVDDRRRRRAARTSMWRRRELSKEQKECTN